VWMRGCVVRRVHAKAGDLYTSWWVRTHTRPILSHCPLTPTLLECASSPTFSVTTDGVGRRFLQDQRTRGQHRPFEVLVKVRVCAGPTP
jgi:hypothetical protein